MNERERVEQWARLAQEDPTAPSTLFVLALNWLDAARYVFDRNFAEAIQIPDAIERNVEFIVKAARHQENALHLEFVRRFHNYLAAAKTMVDNSRTVRTRWGTTEFQHRCTERIRTQLSVPVVKFIQELRNAAQHCQLPDVQRVMTFEPVPPGPNTVNPRLQLMVATSALLAMYSWSPSARAYMDEATEHDSVDMTLALKGYHQTVDAFHTWFVEELKASRRDLLDDFGQRRSRLAAGPHGQQSA